VRRLDPEPLLRSVLEPAAGERVLEVGPGTGYYALPVAGWLGPEDSAFDAAYLVTVLGEIPDQVAALRAPVALNAPAAHGLVTHARRPVANGPPASGPCRRLVRKRA
jgi:hypothetical protein